MFLFGYDIGYVVFDGLFFREFWGRPRMPVVSVTLRFGVRPDCTFACRQSKKKGEKSLH